MNAIEQDAWELFIAWMREAMPALDGTVPVALICMPVRDVGGDDGSINVELRGDGRILWPRTFPVEKRGPLLERLAVPYRRGYVRSL